MFQVSLRTLLEIVAVLGFLLALFYSRNAANGRYQVITSQQADQGGPILVLDTRTGQCWMGHAGTSWQKSIGPVPQE
jgi:hypothetical protein